ncbi:MAG: hypothetical protein KGN00_12670 [Chloroflexota bacterium]|nr:hypothetical protein [Chloroflexota bacterium]MDE3194526.1 hypothetical protein [Chloroflexota bacterium]
MTSDQLAAAIIKAFLGAGEGFLEGTLAAALPVFWLLALALHLARPYMLATTRKFSLRLAADIWWVLYIGLRDVIVVVAFIMSFMYLFPDVVVGNDLPIGGSVATALLFGVLLTKLVADADDDPRAFRVVSYLLAAGATLYIVPTLVGVQVSALGLGKPWSAVAASLVTSQDQTVATALWAVSIVAVSVMGIVAVWFNLRSGETKLGRAER